MNIRPLINANQIKYNNMPKRQKMTSPVSNTIKQARSTNNIAMTGRLMNTIVLGLCQKVPQNAKIKTLAEHIDFKSAKTIQEAMDFGKNNFEIEKYIGFKEGDIDILNWINEGLTNVSNRLKGKVAMPKNIINSKRTNNGVAAIIPNTQDLEIYRTNLEKCINRNIAYISKKAVEYGVSDDEFFRCLKKPDSLSFREKLDFLAEFFLQNSNTARTNYIMTSPFSIIYREMGHLQHFANLDFDLNKFMSLAKKSARPIGLSSDSKALLESFKNSRAKNISKLGSLSPTEFVAETFSGLMQGIGFPDETLDLYRKFNGKMI